MITETSLKTVLVAEELVLLKQSLQTLSENNKVICLDNLFTGKMENIQPLLTHKNFAFINHIVEPITTISEKIDEIYHLACPASPQNIRLILSIL